MKSEYKGEETLLQNKIDVLEQKLQEEANISAILSDTVAILEGKLESLGVSLDASDDDGEGKEGDTKDDDEDSKYRTYIKIKKSHNSVVASKQLPDKEDMPVNWTAAGIITPSPETTQALEKEIIFLREENEVLRAALQQHIRQLEANSSSDEIIPFSAFPTGSRASGQRDISNMAKMITALAVEVEQLKKKVSSYKRRSRAYAQRVADLEVEAVETEEKLTLLSLRVNTENTRRMDV